MLYRQRLSVPGSLLLRIPATAKVLQHARLPRLTLVPLAVARAVGVSFWADAALIADPPADADELMVAVRWDRSLYALHARDQDWVPEYIAPLPVR